MIRYLVCINLVKIFCIWTELTQNFVIKTLPLSIFNISLQIKNKTHPQREKVSRSAEYSQDRLDKHSPEIQCYL